MFDVLLCTITIHGLGFSSGNSIEDNMLISGVLDSKKNSKLSCVGVTGVGKRCLIENGPHCLP